jgi:predicted XRE-type DNA-binding protein
LQLHWEVQQMKRNVPLRQRLLQKVAFTESCWLWMGGTIRGYGRLSVNNKTQKVHRLAYELFKGSIPPGLCVMHSCDVPLCVNPAHLSLGTIQDNNADRKSKGRYAQGEECPRAKLKSEDINPIRALLRQGVLQKEIARQFGVDQTTISDVACGHIWRHVPEVTP